MLGEPKAMWMGGSRRRSSSSPARGCGRVGTPLVPRGGGGGGSGLLRAVLRGSLSHCVGGPGVCRERVGAHRVPRPGNSQAGSQPCPKWLLGVPAGLRGLLPTTQSCSSHRQARVLKASAGAGEKGRKRCTASSAECFPCSWEGRAQPSLLRRNQERAGLLRSGRATRPGPACCQGQAPAPHLPLMPAGASPGARPWARPRKYPLQEG